MLDALKEFYGYGGYTREPAGAYSPGHLIFVGILIVLMIAAAIAVGLICKKKGEKSKDLVLKISAIAFCVIEITRIAGLVIKGWSILNLLPFFLCSIPLFSLPLAAFAKGRLRDSAIDFNAIFGLLIAIMGTVGAAQNFGNYPVISFENVFSAVTHIIPGFVALFIFITHTQKMEKRNMPIVFSFITGFCIVAYIVDKIVDYNYMFLIRDDGTPYSIFTNMVGGNKVLYPIMVVGSLLVYIFASFGVNMLLGKRKK